MSCSIEWFAFVGYSISTLLQIHGLYCPNFILSFHNVLDPLLSAGSLEAALSLLKTLCLRLSLRRIQWWHQMGLGNWLRMCILVYLAHIQYYVAKVAMAPLCRTTTGSILDLPWWTWGAWIPRMLFKIKHYTDNSKHVLFEFESRLRPFDHEK